MTFQIISFRKIVELYARCVSSVLFLAVYYFLTDSKNRSRKGYDHNAKDCPTFAKLQAERRGGAAAAGAVTTGADGECTLSSVDRAACDGDGGQYTCGGCEGRTRRGCVYAGNCSRRISRVSQI